jgi:5-methyltetrahydropteroyltriglutamate--homocysteine methyltransferase
VVRRQVATGIDVVDDGEFGKTMWSRYVIDRLDGIEGRRDWSQAGERTLKGRDRDQFLQPAGHAARRHRTSALPARRG